MLYGANNLGKSEQTERLKEKLTFLGIPLVSLKYPIYELDPTGYQLNQILRYGNLWNASPEETQRIFAQNRRDFEPTLTKILNSGQWVVAEDYKGTGFAWGLTLGVSMEKLLKFNKGLLPEDLAICLDGERFSSGIERGHLYEESDQWELNRMVHQEIANHWGWEVVDSNQTREQVEADIWGIVCRKLSLQI